LLIKEYSSVHLLDDPETMHMKARPCRIRRDAAADSRTSSASPAAALWTSEARPSRRRHDAVAASRENATQAATAARAGGSRASPEAPRLKHLSGGRRIATGGRTAAAPQAA